MRPLVIEFDPPAPMLNLNDREHHHARAAKAKLWRTAAWAAANNRRRHPSWPKDPLGRCSVHVDLPMSALARRRDPHNWSPTVKAIVDGLVDARIFPDDSMEHVEIVDPIFHDRTIRPQVAVRIWPEEAP